MWPVLVTRTCWNCQSWLHYWFDTIIWDPIEWHLLYTSFLIIQIWWKKRRNGNFVSMLIILITCICKNAILCKLYFALLETFVANKGIIMFELDKRIMFTILPFLLFIPNFVYFMKNSNKFASVGNTHFVTNNFF